MTTSSDTSKSPEQPIVTGAPPLAPEVEVKAGPGQKVVTSPTGTKTVVDEGAADSLKSQGYKVT